MEVVMSAFSEYMKTNLFSRSGWYPTEVPNYHNSKNHAFILDKFDAMAEPSSYQTYKDLQLRYCS